MSDDDTLHYRIISGIPITVKLNYGLVTKQNSLNVLK